MWDIDWLRFDAAGGRVRKLSITDTGTGMTAEQLHRYINQLASSGREQSADSNFGVGAKVAAGCRNPDGRDYRSWHQGKGRWCASSDTPTVAGDWSPNAGRTATPTFATTLRGRQAMALHGRDHGTQVVLLGEHERDDTLGRPRA